MMPPLQPAPMPQPPAATGLSGTHGPRNVQTTLRADEAERAIIIITLYLLPTFLYNTVYIILPNNIFIYINNGNVRILLLLLDHKMSCFIAMRVQLIVIYYYDMCVCVCYYLLL
uniref:Uncharacterized protein n=1 Tax=Schizaphis graminum TaxID=13262 RepID=A0A2S2P8I5_SCHGA